MKNKVAAALFAFFLGGFGIHRFYLGQVGLGFIYLIFCWTFIPVLIGFIDGIVFLVTDEQSFNAKYNSQYLRSQSHRNNLINQAPIKSASYFTGDDGHLAFFVAGTKFRNLKEIQRIHELVYAEELQLIPEPQNPYDPYAIAIYTMDNSLVGHIPKEMTHLMRENSGVLKKYRCVFTKRTEHNPPFINVRVEFN